MTHIQKIAEIKRILVKHNALTNFISNAGSTKSHKGIFSSRGFFTWSKTPQGHSYWLNISEKIEEFGLSDTEFTIAELLNPKNSHTEDIAIEEIQYGTIITIKSSNFSFYRDKTGTLLPLPQKF